MMPYERCQQSDDCWLRTYCQSIDMPLPKFHLGQILVSSYTDDETGQTYSYRIQVVGFTKNIPAWLRTSGWWYFCKFLAGSHTDYLIAAHVIEPFHESELEEEISTTP